MAKLQLVSVTKRFGNTIAVDEVDLTVEDNELFCLFGPPACGKTTILRLFLGLETPDRGEIRIGGRDVTRVSPADRDLAMVFQNLALFPHMSVRENLAFPLVERRMEPGAIAAKVAAAAEILHITHLLDMQPAKLSGGERQRVALGRALVREPNAYLLDEPISALDAKLREEMRVELNRLQRQLKHTFVYVTHDQEEAMAVADRVCVLRQGRIAQIGTPLEVYNSPNSQYVARQLGSPSINFIEGWVDRSDGSFAAADVPFRGKLRTAIDVEGRAKLGVRPEDISISRQPNGPRSLAASVYEVEPLGAITIVDLKIGGQLLKAQVQRQPCYAQGEEVFLTFAAEKCHVFDGATQQRLATGIEV
jgi:multiple sugar transport system ATP-binding protein